MCEDTIIDLEQASLVQRGRTPILPTITRRPFALAGVLFVFLGATLGMLADQPNLTVPTSRSLTTLEQPGIIAEDSLDVQAFIDSQIRKGVKHIVIPPGRHYVEPQHHNGKMHIFLKNLKDITIDGMDKAEIVCKKTTRAISLFNCQNVTLKGLVVDYDPLPFTQGKIVAMSADKLTLTVSMIKGYPGAETIVTQKNIEIYDSDTNELSTVSYYGVKVDMVDQSEETVIVTKNPHYASVSTEKVGDVVVFFSKNMPNSIPHAVFAQDCTNLRVERVKLYASNMFGYLENGCNNTGFINSSIDRRLPEDDLQERGHRRLRSANADGFHSKHARVGPKFKSVTVRYNGDDGIAVNGDYHLISKISDGPSNTIRIIGKKGKAPNLSAGEEVELVMYSGARMPNAKVVSFNPESTFELEEAERKFLGRQRFSGQNQLTNFADKAYMVTLDRAIDMPMGSLIASANSVGNGYRIEDSTIGPNRARGLLLKASNGVVTGNVIRDTWIAAILIAPEYVWLEAGSGDNISITNNTIERSHDVGIMVTARGGDNSVAPAGAHTGIMIADNTLTGCSNPAIAVTSTNGLIMFLNNITETDNSIIPSTKRFMYGRQANPERKVYLENIGLATRDTPAGLSIGSIITP